MQKTTILLFLLILLVNTSYGQLVDHYKFKDNDNGQSYHLVERMEQTKTPGMTFYIDYADGFDSLAIGNKGPQTNEPISHETIFPVGDISFFPLQIELLRMQAAGLLNLDDPIKQYIPALKDSRLFKSKVTIRDLLLIKTKFNGPYKPTGYEKGAPRVPVQTILTKGNQDFKGGIKIKSGKNTRQNSECTYAILGQLIIEKIHKKPIAQVIQENIFQPIGMVHSFYASELSATQEALAASGTVDGTPIPDGYRRYEALGAAGLWTTAKDICKLVRHVMDAAKGNDNRILSVEDAKKGIYSQDGYASLIFNTKGTHTIYGGGNSKGFYTCLEADLEKDFVQVVFANADLVWPLVNFAIGQTGTYIDKKRKSNPQNVNNYVGNSPNKRKNEVQSVPGKIEFIGNAGSDNVFTVEKWAFTKVENPDQPEKIIVAAVLDMSSISCSWKDLETNLKKKKDYFYIKKFPEATIQINGATLLENGNYRTDALLTLKGISKVVPLEFSISKEAPYRVQAKGIVFRSTFNFKGDGPKEEVPVTVDAILLSSQ